MTENIYIVNNEKSRNFNMTAYLTISSDLYPKSLYISRAMSNLYGKEIEIWAGFWPVGSTEKKIELIISNF